MPRKPKTSRYANRSDLASKPTQALPSGRAYGQRQALAGQQAAAPMQDPKQALLAQAVAAAQADPNGVQADFTRPTDRPNEPLTAGAPMGPGGGPEVLPGTAPGHPVNQLRALYRAYPFEEIRQMLEIADTREADRIAAGMPNSR